jgi:predicted permease
VPNRGKERGDAVIGLNDQLHAEASRMRFSKYLAVPTTSSPANSYDDALSPARRSSGRASRPRRSWAQPWAIMTSVSTMSRRCASLAVMVLAAALPIGANVFLFSQRYKVAEELVTASLAVSTGLGLLTLSLVMWLLTWLSFRA